MAKAKKTKFNLVNELYENLLKTAQVTKTGAIKLKRTEVKALIETVFESGAKRAASGERVRFPIIGALVRKEVAARKAGKGKNPFTGEDMTIKARAATKKPRWSFPKGLKETFANKKHW
jgi:nucleoid DNA-binding protein